MIRKLRQRPVCSVHPVRRLREHLVLKLREQLCEPIEPPSEPEDPGLTVLHRAQMLAYNTCRLQLVETFAEVRALAKQENADWSAVHEAFRQCVAIARRWQHYSPGISTAPAGFARGLHSIATDCTWDASNQKDFFAILDYFEELVSLAPAVEVV